MICPRPIQLVHVLLTSLALAGCSSSSDEEEQAGDGSLEGVIFGEGAAEGGTGRGFSGQVCAGESAGAELAPSILQLLVDTSGSMDQDAPGGQRTKWEVTRSSVLDAIAGMPTTTTLGVVFYPNVPNDTRPCFDQRTAVSLNILSADGSQQRQQINNAFSRQRPQGGTPTHDAYRYAINQVKGINVAGARFVVLITDGTPTYSVGCVGTGMQTDPVDSSPLIVEAASAFATGLRTFVIGSPGSEDARVNLSRMAEAGGTARPGCSHDGPNYCHFDMTRERDLGAGLSSALELISGVALSCYYEIPQPPNGAQLDLGKVNVLFTPAGGPEELILQSPDQGCSEGWQYTDGNNRIQLCGSTCDRVRDSNGGLTLEFGCATQVR
jgi:hypothetical protein